VTALDSLAFNVAGSIQQFRQVLIGQAGNIGEEFGQRAKPVGGHCATWCATSLGIGNFMKATVIRFESLIAHSTHFKTLKTLCFGGFFIGSDACPESLRLLEAP